MFTASTVALTSCTSTDGGVRSTITHTCGRSPTPGGALDLPAPLRPRKLKPYMPSSSTSITQAWACGGTSCFFHSLQSWVYHTSTPATPAGPTSLASKFRVIRLVLTSRTIGAARTTLGSGDSAGSPAAAASTAAGGVPTGGGTEARAAGGMAAGGVGWRSGLGAGSTV